MPRFRAPGLALALVVTAVAPASAQESRAYYDTPSIVLDYDSPPFQRLLDFDGDGDMDAVGHRVSTTGEELDLRVWENDGEGRMVEVFQTSAMPYDASSSGMQVAVGDFDDDGLDDFLLGGEASEGYSVFTSLGDGSFTRVDHDPGSPIVDSVVATDADGDGVDDAIAIVRIPGQPLQVIAHLSSDGLFQATVGGPIVADYAFSLQADGDAARELVLVYGENAHVFGIDGGAVSVGPHLVATIGIGSFQVRFAGGDVDGDGDEDVVAFQMFNKPTDHEVFRNDGASSFVLESAQVGGPAEFLMDADGDGDLDGVCCGGGSGGGGGGGGGVSFPNLGFASQFEIALNDGTGLFAEAFSIRCAGSKSLAGVADLDGDGDRDLVAGASIHYAHGPLTESPQTNIAAQRVQMHDVDRDGDIDVARGHFLLTDFILEVNDGAGGFETVEMPGITAPAGLFFRSKIPGDFTGDGAVDYLTYAIIDASPYETRRMHLIENRGSGHFRDAGPATDVGVEIQVGTTISYVTADVDDDGDLDIFARTSFQTPKQSELFLNDGAGYFRFFESYPWRVEAVDDYDGDGRPDLLIDPGTGMLAVAFGIPAAPEPQFGALQPAFSEQANPFDRRITSGDFNDDGKPDVAYIDAVDVPRIYYNQTTPGGLADFFLSDVLDDLVIDGKFSQVEPVDINFDGACDIVVGDTDSLPGVTQLVIASAPLPAMPTANDYEPRVAQYTFGSIAHDLDGDGAKELLDFSFVRNRHWPLHEGGYRHQYGAGSPDALGIQPVLGASGPFRAGESASLRLTGTEGGALAILVIGTGQVTIPGFPDVGLVTYAWPWNLLKLFAVGGPAGEPGAGMLEIPYTVNAGMAGAPVYFQFFVIDSALESGFSNGLHLEHAL